MRELTIEEVEFVSGGYDPYDDGEEIVVTGSRYGSNSGYSMSYSQYQGMQSFYNSPFGGSGSSSYGGGTGSPAPTHHPDGTDNDGDGINETPPIVVTAQPMTPEQRAAYDHHRQVATWTVNGIYYGILARLGYSGYAGAAGAAGAVGTQALSDAREQMIDNNADLNYRRDGADGVYDGHFDPGYITGDRTLPQQ